MEDPTPPVPFPYVPKPFRDWEALSACLCAVRSEVGPKVAIIISWINAYKCMVSLEGEGTKERSGVDGERIPVGVSIECARVARQEMQMWI